MTNGKVRKMGLALKLKSFNVKLRTKLGTQIEGNAKDAESRYGLHYYGVGKDVMMTL